MTVTNSGSFDGSEVVQVRLLYCLLDHECSSQSVGIRDGRRIQRRDAEPTACWLPESIHPVRIQGLSQRKRWIDLSCSAGSSETVSIEVQPTSLELWSLSNKYVVEPGVFVIKVRVVHPTSAESAG